MNSRRHVVWLFCGAVFASLVFGGCGYSIKYGLNDQDIVSSSHTNPLNVQVAVFSDTRPPEEREKSAREELGQSDLRDYTFNKEFKGEVAEGVTNMLVEHLAYSRVFQQITASSIASDQLSDGMLDSLATQGVDALLVGEVAHFYGYYDQSLARKLLYSVPLGVLSAMLFSFTTDSYVVYWYGPGLVLGNYLESRHSRRIEDRTELRVKLFSTATHEQLWENSFDVSSSGDRAMPGISTEQRKFQVAVWSLRDLVNQIVEDLAEASFAVPG